MKIQYYFPPFMCKSVFLSSTPNSFKANFAVGDYFHDGLLNNYFREMIEWFKEKNLSYALQIYSVDDNVNFSITNALVSGTILLLNFDADDDDIVEFYLRFRDLETAFSIEKIPQR